MSSLAELVALVQKEQEEAEAERTREKETSERSEEEGFEEAFAAAWPCSCDVKLVGLREVVWSLPSYDGPAVARKGKRRNWKKTPEVRIAKRRQGWVLVVALPVPEPERTRHTDIHTFLRSIREVGEGAKDLATEFHSHAQLRGLLREVSVLVREVQRRELLRVVAETNARVKKVEAEIEEERARIEVFPSPLEALAHVGNERKRRKKE
jgi:hypothetical protein